MSEVIEVRCSRCKKTKPQTEFPILSNLAYAKNCFICREKNKARADRQPKKAPGPSDRGKDTSGEQIPEISLSRLISLMEKHGSVKPFEIHVNIKRSELVLLEGEERTPENLLKCMASHIYQATGYRFNYKGKRPNKGNTDVHKFEFYCAQLDGEQTKNHLVDDVKKQRGRTTMDRFKCNGHLNITLNSSRTEFMMVRLSHHLAHKHYTDISIPADIKKYIRESKGLTATKIYEEIIKMHPKTELTEKQVYRCWSDVNQGRWRKADDQVESAKILLQEYKDLTIDIVEINPEPGLSTIAFIFREILDEYGGDVEEIAMDSTWKTNAAGYELYAIVAEANGTALPLAFVFTTSAGEAAAEGAKDRMLQQVLRAISTDDGAPNIRFVHTDKDLSEINAARAVFPDSKHQVCMWHGPRYVKERLCQDKLPAYYDPRKAHKVYKIIDPTWCPGVPKPCEDPNLDHVGSDDEAEELGASENDSADGADDIQGFDDSGSEYDPEEAHTEPDTCLPPLFILTQGDVKLPIYPNPPKVRKADIGEFCPKEFRESTLELFKMHGRLHPHIPINEPDDPEHPYVSAEEIYKWVVFDMYCHCWDNDLPQVWAYMWNRWYCPAQWKLWARASEPAIPRINTTMIVESIWKHVKHRDLSDFNRPRLDLVTYVIIENLLPRVKRNLDGLRRVRRIGRGRELVGWQKDFRIEWLELSKRDELRSMERELQVWVQNPKKSKERDVRLARIAENAARQPGSYFTDLDKWVCSCTAFLMSRFLMCKHLVREANELLDNSLLKDLALFAELRRNHFAPFYRIPGIHSMENDDEEDMDDVEILVLHRDRSRTQSMASSRVPSPDLDDEDQTDLPMSGLEDSASAEQESQIGADSDLEDDIRALASDDEGPASQKIYLSKARLENLKRSFAAMLETASDPQGMAPKLAEAIMPAVEAVEDTGGSIDRYQRRRKTHRTYKDSDKYTMFLPN
ncbi:unnamed protein product [Mycena citricolor]|uniref:SWIM-type domain-containing protein n=1 Tax=Mycena citricolor TaxID=2018698 RepID=A0AAD2I017_9AGAR|nr:unnamed protein product [Mycena citricolor]